VRFDLASWTVVAIRVECEVVACFVRHTPGSLTIKFEIANAGMWLA
jgi:hypothetical protein